MEKLRNVIIKKFPSIYEESYTTLELIRKVIEYLDQCIDQSNETYNAVAELKEWFNTLDVNDEISAKLDIMDADGTLARIINQDIFTEFYNSTRAVGYGDKNSSSFVDSVNYCRTNNLKLVLTRDYTLTLTENLELCEIDGNGHTITLQGSKYFILLNKEVKNLKIVRTENYLSMENTVSTGFTLRNVIFEYPSIDNTLVTRALNIVGTGKFIMEDVTAYNYLTPFRIDMTGELSYVKNVIVYNGGQGLYLLNAKKVTIDNLQLFNTGAQKTNITTSYPINGGVAGYDGLLLKNCVDVTINNLYIVGAPERVLYSDDSNNVTLNNVTGIITGGIKFVGYNIMANNFTVNGGRLDNVSGDALVQLYKCERIIINGLTSKNSSTSTGGGWFIRAGQEVREVRVVNCEANNIVRSVFDYNQNFPSAYANPYCGGIVFENCLFTNIGLISNLPYPLFNFVHNITSGTNIINTVEIRKCTFKAFGGYGDRDNGSRNNYGIKGIVTGNYITNFTFEDNSVNGLVDFENPSHPALLMSLTNSSNIRFIHKMKSSVSDITSILPQNIPFTSDSIIDVNVATNTTQGYLKIKPRAILGTNDVILYNDYVMTVDLTLLSIGSVTPFLRISPSSAIRMGNLDVTADSKNATFLFGTSTVTVKTTDDSLFASGSWVSDGKIRVYDDADKMTLRCSLQKDITVKGTILT